MNDPLDPILQQESQRRLKVQLAWRLGIAATLIVIALFGISWLDRQQSEKPATTTPTPIIAPPTIEPLAPPTAAEQATASQASEASKAEIPSTPALSSASGVIEGASHRPSNTPSPTPSSKPSLKLEGISPTSKPLATLAPSPAPVAQRTPTPVATTPAPNISTASPSNIAATAVPYPSSQHTPNGYTVQAGVFLHAENAGKLLAQLKTAGVPAFIETRVQIGPFKDKASADAAADKLKRLGITPAVRGN
ncbi:SPOR domain-containing protein [Iodobacter sp.]|uniref:SPOR domain-containing protein n=1 Tax=Iodobacter sp. TaxID=1915058 RepID=UPI0025E3232F|nr:SPOR domain-containing protein [Iodobacter sp.]